MTYAIEQLSSLFKAGTVWRLLDRASDTHVDVLPSRGGLVTAMRVKGTELLYLDASTVDDTAKNVRGGVPVLFPIAGPLPDNAYALAGKTYAMKQHGFARNRAFEVVAHEANDAHATITLRLRDDDETRAQYPFAFALDYVLTLSRGVLTLTTRITNRSETAMPVQLGFHPYFTVPAGEKKGTTVTTDATHAFDNVTKTEGPFNGFALDQGEVDLHLLDHSLRTTDLSRPDGTGVRIEADANFRVLVVWTQPGKDFVCVEPWTDRGGVLAHGTAHPVAPNAVWETTWSIGARPNH